MGQDCCRAAIFVEMLPSSVPWFSQLRNFLLQENRSLFKSEISSSPFSSPLISALLWPATEPTPGLTQTGGLRFLLAVGVEWRKSLIFLVVVVVVEVIGCFTTPHQLKNCVRTKFPVFVISLLCGNEFLLEKPLQRAVPYGMSSNNRIILVVVTVYYFPISFFLLNRTLILFIYSPSYSFQDRPRLGITKFFPEKGQSKYFKYLVVEGLNMGSVTTHCVTALCWA